MSFKQITQAEAKKMMDSQDNVVILDVRTHDEYKSGHIEGAICYPVEDISSDVIEEIKDKNTVILVYCRTGRRSKLAAQKLYDMGYKNIYEFGGITTWRYGIVT